MSQKIFELALHLKASDREEFDKVIGELGKLHVRNSVGTNTETLEISYIGKAEPVQAGLLLSVFTEVRDHTVTAKLVK